MAILMSPYTVYIIRLVRISDKGVHRGYNSPRMSPLQQIEAPIASMVRPFVRIIPIYSQIWDHFDPDHSRSRVTGAASRQFLAPTPPSSIMQTAWGLSAGATSWFPDFTRQWTLFMTLQVFISSRNQEEDWGPSGAGHFHTERLLVLQEAKRP